MYFKNFPIIPYKFGNNNTESAFVDLSVSTDLFNNIKDNASFYTFYQVQNGDRPDIVSKQIYGTTDYYWTFYLLNDNIRTYGWMLSEDQLLQKLEKDLPGVCLVVFGRKQGVDTNFEQHTLIDKFPIGSRVTGLISGAQGTVYARNMNLGQLFVKSVTGSFVPNETIVDNSSGSPLYASTVSIIHSPAYLATHHYQDGDGTHVDVDYSSDFRGRGPENPQQFGGVWDDLTYPDVYASTSPYTNVTYYEHYEKANFNASKIKIIKLGLIQEFVKLFRRSVA